MSFDSSLMQAIADHRTGWATAISNGLMQLGNTPRGAIVLVAVCVVAVIWLRAFRPALAAVIALVAARVTADVLKEVFDRPRPPTHLALVFVSGPSFPSTHAAATAAGAVAFVVAYSWTSVRAQRLATGALAAVVVLIGACMVYLGAHWLTDVLAGWLLGGAIGYVVGRAFQRRPVLAVSDA